MEMEVELHAEWKMYARQQERSVPFPGSALQPIVDVYNKVPSLNGLSALQAAQATSESIWLGRPQKFPAPTIIFGGLCMYIRTHRLSLCEGMKYTRIQSSRGN